MHFVIMGCGRVGSTLAQILEEQGHTVAVIDQTRRPSAGWAPGSAAAGSPASASTGTPCARPASRRRSAFAAVSSGDNSNIIAARVARETFGVENVVARIYDPRPRRGLPAAGHPHGRHRPLDGRPDAAPAAAARRGAASGATPAARCGSPRCTSTPAWIGAASQPARGGDRRAASRSSPGSARACCPAADTVLQEGDLVHVMMRDGDADAGRGGASPTGPARRLTDAGRHRRSRQRRAARSRASCWRTGTRSCSSTRTRPPSRSSAVPEARVAARRRLRDHLAGRGRRCSAATS